MSSDGFRALVAGVGNVLRGDDGFGVAVIEALEEGSLPPGCEAVETGIGGIHLVQTLMGPGYDGLVIVDAVDRGADPGTVFHLEVEVPEAGADGTGPPTEIDLHQADPSRILVLARAAGVLPGRLRIVGCQPHRTEPGMDLSPAVADSVAEAVEVVRGLLREWRDEYAAEVVSSTERRTG